MRWRGGLLVALAASVVLALLWWVRAGERAAVPRTEYSHEVRLPDRDGEEPFVLPEVRREGETSAVTVAPTHGVAGLVSGKHGGIWGIRVAAVRGDTVLGETTTRPNGRYRIDLDAADDFDVLAEPPGETGLKRMWRRGLSLRDGGRIEVDFVFATSRRVKGVLLGPDGKGMADVRVNTVHEEHWPRLERDGNHPAVLRDLPKESARTGPLGEFEVEGLVEGRHRLLMRDARWMFPEPVVIGPDSVDVTARAVRAAIVQVFARDKTLQRPIPEFEVHVRFAGGRAYTFRGRRGKVQDRVPNPDDLTPQVLVTAPGYRALEVERRTGFRAALELARPPNLLAEILDDAGAPVEGPVSCHGEGVIPFRLERGAVAGAYRATLPPGRYGLVFKRPLMPLSTTLSEDVRIPDAGAWREALRFPPGGALLVRNEGAAGRSLTAIQGPGADGPNRMFGRVELKSRETTLRDVAPGNYVLSLDSFPPRRGPNPGWSGRVEVRVGETTVVEVP